MDAVEAVHGALVELGYPVSIVPLSPPLETALASCDTWRLMLFQFV